jgi:hypothetical protein
MVNESFIPAAPLYPPSGVNEAYPPGTRNLVRVRPARMEVA